MKRKAISPVAMVLTGIGLIVLGILMFVFPDTMVALMELALSWVLVVYAVIVYIQFLNYPGLNFMLFWKSIVFVALAVVLTLLTQVVNAAISIVAGVWVIANAVTKVLYGIQLIKTKSSGAVATFIIATLYVAFAVILFINPMESVAALAVVIGVYAVICGVSHIVDGIRDLLGTDIDGKRVKQHLRIKPPVFLTAIIPMRLAKRLDDPDEEAEIAQWTYQETVLENPKPNLEIFIHLGKNVAMGMGHVDIAVDDTVYAFGCYDSDSNRLFGLLSDGVLFKADREAYIPFSVEHEKKRLLGYGVVLSEEQKQSLLKAVDKALEGSKEWVPTKEGEMMDMRNDCDAVYYKIQKGPFKTYNTFTTNCVAMANILCSNGGVDLMNPQGVVTPGTYVDFLDRQLRRPRSIVVTRTIYR